jgi:hypothetical protein
MYLSLVVQRLLSPSGIAHIITRKPPPPLPLTSLANFFLCQFLIHLIMCNDSIQLEERQAVNHKIGGLNPGAASRF